jgi:hypothetical protein
MLGKLSCTKHIRQIQYLLDQDLERNAQKRNFCSKISDVIYIHRSGILYAWMDGYIEKDGATCDCDRSRTPASGPLFGPNVFPKVVSEKRRKKI